MTKQYILNKVKSTILSVDKKAKVILFGSRARGDNREDSDWDFLILTSFPENNISKDKFRDKIFDTELELEQAISTIIHNKKRWEDYEVTPFYQNITEEGIEL